MNTASYTLTDSDAVKNISSRIPGWSGPVHYLFFKSLLAAHPTMTRFLMLGVYHGRDIAFILDILARYHPGRQMEIVGVDRFEARACADWPADKVGEPWEKAVNAPPPNYLAAVENTRSPFVTIMAMDDEKFLNECPLQFHAGFLDTSHDDPTVSRQLSQLRKIVTGILCGDDYVDTATWGVKRAVCRAFSTHSVFNGWIWYAPVANLVEAVNPMPANV